MTWTQTHERYELLLAAEAELAERGTVAWRAELADVFGSPARLRLALASRWRTLVDAQGQDVPVAELAAARPGLARAAGLTVPTELAVAS